MTQARDVLILVAALALFAVGCGTGTQVNATTSVAPTPIPTKAALFVPTSPPASPTPTPFPILGDDSAVGADDTADDAIEASAIATDAERLTPTPEPIPTAIIIVEPTATPLPQILPVPTAQATAVPTARPAQATAVPTARPAQARAPTPVPAPAPRPTPRPTSPPTQVCPAGQIIGASGLCTCPGGQAKRASDGQCVRLCNQSDLTITNSCVCTGSLYDNGGQCARRCASGEVPDGYAGCKQPDPIDLSDANG